MLRAKDDSFRSVDEGAGSSSSFLRKIRSVANCDHSLLNRDKRERDKLIDREKQADEGREEAKEKKKRKRKML